MKLIINTIFIVTVLLSSFSAATQAGPALGDLRILSAHDEPLKAEIELQSFEPETRLEQIKVRIPPLATYQRLSLGRDAFVSTIRLNSVKKGSGYLVRLSAEKPLPPSPTQLLLELDINGESVMEHYELLLPSMPTQLTEVAPQDDAAPSGFMRDIPARVVFGASDTATVPTTNRAASSQQASIFFREQRVTGIRSESDVFPHNASMPSADFRPRPRAAAKVAPRPERMANTLPRPKPDTSKPKVAPAELTTSLVAGQPARVLRPQISGLSADHDALKVPVPAAEIVSQPAVTPPARMRKQTALLRPGGQTPDKTHYTVRRGDTLFKIAAAEKFSGVTTEQMVLALQRKNPAALSLEKIDQLAVGQRLRLPGREEVAAVSSKQGQDFRRAYLDWQRQLAVQKRAAAKKSSVGLPVKQDKAARPAVKTANAPKQRMQQSAAVRSPNVPPRPARQRLGNVAQTTATTLPQKARRTNVVAKPVTANGKLQAAITQRVQRPVQNPRQAAVSTAKPRAKPTAKPNAKPAPKNVNTAQADTILLRQSERKVTLLEDRLRKVKRLLDIEKQQHTTTKRVLREKNRLIQRKDTMIRDLRIAGVRGNKAQAQSSASSMVSGGTTAVAAAPVRPIPPPKQAVKPANQVPVTPAVTNTAQSGIRSQDKPTDSTQPAQAVAESGASGWRAVADVLARYPALMILVPMLLLLGPLLLILRAQRKRNSRYEAWPMSPRTAAPSNQAGYALLGTAGTAFRAKRARNAVEQVSPTQDALVQPEPSDLLHEQQEKLAQSLRSLEHNSQQLDQLR